MVSDELELSASSSSVSFCCACATAAFAWVTASSRSAGSIVATTSPACTVEPTATRTEFTVPPEAKASAAVRRTLSELSADTVWATDARVTAAVR